MESVRCARAMGRGIGQWIDNLELLDDRTGPPVRDDERQRIFMFRTNVNEMNVQPIDLGYELRQCIQFRLALPPIVICPPNNARSPESLRAGCLAIHLQPSPGRATLPSLCACAIRRVPLAESSHGMGELLHLWSPRVLGPGSDWKQPLQPKRQGSCDGRGTAVSLTWSSLRCGNRTVLPLTVVCGARLRI